MIGSQEGGQLRQECHYASSFILMCNRDWLYHELIMALIYFLHLYIEAAKEI